MTGLTLRKQLAPLLAEADLDFFANEFRRTGFGAALNWYRNIDRFWELTPFLDGARLAQPTLFVVGDNDPVIEFLANAYQSMEAHVPNLKKKVLLKSASHCIQHERPAAVNRLRIEFLKT